MTTGGPRIGRWPTTPTPRPARARAPQQPAPFLYHLLRFLALTTLLHLSFVGIYRALGPNAFPIAWLVGLVGFAIALELVAYHWYDIVLAYIPFYGCFFLIKIYWRLASPTKYWSRRSL